MGTNNPSGGQQNSVWRQFRGRLYSRLGEKRLGELDLIGLLNTCHVFLAVLKSFGSAPAQQQAKLDVLKNFYHMILNTFARIKNINKIDHILALSSAASSTTTLTMSTAAQARLNTVKAIATMKFVALRLVISTIRFFFNY